MAPEVFSAANQMAPGQSGGVDLCLLWALLIVCPPAGIAWWLLSRRRPPVPTGRDMGTGGPCVPKIAEAARAARRDQIIAAALTCFARAGYHATTMADVAAQAGVSKGTPYLYFESKEALFIALHEEWDCGTRATG